VEVDLSEEGLRGGFDVREKDGFATVVEAIGGTVWSSAVMTDAKKKAQRNMRRCADAGGSGDADATISTSTYVAPVSTVTSTPISLDPLPTHEKGLADPNPMFNNNEPQTQTEEEKKDETSAAVMEDIEHIMKEAQRIREAAKGNDVSDDERRERAGNAADMLMGLLDQLGFDDDDDGEGDGDCESSDEE